MINESQSGAKDAAKCLKKKLVPKNTPPVQLKSLIVLETAAKNCGKRFHLQVAMLAVLLVVLSPRCRLL
jgi:hypothetical protein